MREGRGGRDGLRRRERSPTFLTSALNSAENLNLTRTSLHHAFFLKDAAMIRKTENRASVLLPPPSHIFEGFSFSHLFNFTHRQTKTPPKN